MQIASHLFLLLFLPLTIFLYYKFFKQPRMKIFFLLLASYIFYAFAGWQFLFVLFGLSLITYVLALQGRTNWGVFLNLFALGVFKYWNFGIENFNSIMQSTGLVWNINLLHLGLPLGISFFVFKHIGYLLDVRNGRYQATKDFWLFATYSAYFPQISAGPISSFKDASQFKNLPQKLDPEKAYQGLLFISMGLAKKVLIADTLNTFVSPRIGNLQGLIGIFPAWHFVILYAMQLYFDFSGYTDMVLGISTLFGISLPPNFNSPYLSKDIGNFWERWHISLSLWFRTYLFFPISRSLLTRSGSAARDRVQYTANIITMSIIGLWHGAGWGFILWGTYHGVLLNLNAWIKKKNWSVHPVVNRIFLIITVMFGWAFFLSPDMPSLLYLLSQLVGFGYFHFRELWPILFSDPSTPALLMGLVLAFSSFSEAANIAQPGNKYRLWNAILFGVLAALCILFIQKDIQFAYVQF